MTYKEFIDNILNTRGRFNCGDAYHERHHILPKCCGGKNNTENLIDLFPREHFIAHKLLAEENPDNYGLAYAYLIMAFGSNEKRSPLQLTPEEYEEVRTLFSQRMKEKFKDKTKHPNWGKKLSEETRRKISESHKGLQSSLGRVLSEETKKKIGDANRNPSPEKRRRMSEGQIRGGHSAGANNGRARQVIRLSDGHIFPYCKQAAKEIGMSYTWLQKTARAKNGDYMYYDEWLQLNKIEK